MSSEAAALPDIVQRAHALMAKGDLAAAEALYRQALAADPDHVEALHSLGRIAAQANRPDAALALIGKALAQHKEPPLPMRFDMARVLQMAGRHEESLAQSEEILRRAPEHTGALIYRGLVLSALDRKEEAAASYVRALEQAPQMPELHYNLANMLKDLGRIPQAASHYEKAIDILSRAQRPDRYLYANVHNNFGHLYADFYEHEKAIRHYQKAITLDPNLWFTYLNCGNSYRLLGDIRNALACYGKAASMKPAMPGVLWAYTIAHVPVFFERAEDVDLSRKVFNEKLDRLNQWFHARPPSDDDGAVGEGILFSLAYQERNNRELLAKYGRLCARLMKGWFDRQSFAPPPPHVPRRPLRVGMVSAHFRTHSVWHAITKGWLRYLDPAEIEVHLFACDYREDKETAWAKAKTASYQAIHKNTADSVRAILARELDVLIYPDIGMDAEVIKLASLRLAPIQMVTWGHPETTGLPTMDYYISAEDFEPPDGDDAYAEKLIRLPHLGCCYEPMAIESEPPDLAKLGIREGVPLLLSPGLTIKYAPEYDGVFIDLVRKIGDCQIVFFRGPDGLSEKFRLRLRALFEKEGVDFGSHCVFVPWQTPAGYHGLLEKATVFLDTLGFSGFNTAIQAIQCGTPIVAYDGRFMRGRFAAGILRRLEITGLIADSRERYVELAYRMVHDPLYLDSVKQQIVDRRERLWEDPLPVAALQKILIDLAINR